MRKKNSWKAWGRGVIWFTLRILKCHFGHLVRKHHGETCRRRETVGIRSCKNKIIIICYCNNSDEILMGAETGDSDREDEKYSNSKFELDFEGRIGRICQKWNVSARNLGTIFSNQEQKST